MSELKPCDFLGNEIRMGDEVAFFALGYRMFTRGIVVRITPKCLFIDYDNSWNYDHHEEHTRQEQKQVIDLTALNRRAQLANETLTLEQLREMEWYEPVYVKFKHAIPSKMVSNLYDCLCYIGASESNYGKTWLAYRHKPKEDLQC